MMYSRIAPYPDRWNLPDPKFRLSDIGNQVSDYGIEN
jgi:hypothetical protein